MKRGVHYFVSALCILLFSGCTTRVAIDDTLALEDPVDTMSEAETVLATWCDGPAVQVGEALSQSFGQPHDTADSRELSFREMQTILDETQQDAPPALDITLTSAIGSLDDLIQLLEAFNWELYGIDQDRFSRIYGQVEGAVSALDDFNIQECGLDSGFNSLAALEAGATDWCDAPASQLREAMSESIGRRHINPDSLELSFRRLLTALQQTQQDAPPALDITLTSAIGDLEDLIQLLDESGWELESVEPDRFTRINSRVDGSISALDDFNILECGIDSGFNSPAAIEADKNSWCDGRANEVQRAVLDAVTVDTDDPQAFEQVYTELTQLLDDKTPVPKQVEVRMVVAVENLNETTDYLADSDWVLDETNGFEWQQLTYDLEELFGGIDEYTLVECDGSSSLVFPVLEFADDYGPDASTGPGPDETADDDDEIPPDGDVAPASDPNLDDIDFVVSRFVDNGFTRIQAFCLALIVFGLEHPDPGSDEAVEAQNTGCGITQERLNEIFDLEEVTTDALPSHVEAWRLLTATPALGVHDRLANIAPFPTSHVAPVRSFTSLTIDYSPYPDGGGYLDVILTYDSALSQSDTVALITAAMVEQEQRVVIVEADDLSITAESSPSELADDDPDASHTVTFRDVGDDETEVEAIFTTNFASPEMDASLREAARQWHNETWPEPPNTSLGYLSAYYLWTNSAGISADLQSDYFFDDDADPEQSWQSFRDALRDSGTAWEEEDFGHGGLFITDGGTHCASLWNTFIGFVTVYPADPTDSSC